MNRHFPYITSILALSVLALMLASCNGKAPAKAVVEPVSVRVEPVAVERIASPIAATGTLAPKDGIDLSFKVGGVVARVLVDDGARVRAGQLLAALDPGEIGPAVARAEAAADKAQRDLVRVQRLYADSVVTLAQLQDAGTARDAAVAELEAARFNGSHSRIVAPADGVVLRRLAEPGEVVSPGVRVLAFASGARGQVVRVGLADRDLVRVHSGDRAEVRFDALPGRVFEGAIAEVGAAPDPATGTYAVEIAVRGAEALATGLVASVEIRPRSQSDVALVPMTALVEATGDAASVYTLDASGRHAERRTVRLAFLAGDRVAIAGGLEGVKRVITDGAARIGAGDPVEVER